MRNKLTLLILMIFVLYTNLQGSIYSAGFSGSPTSIEFADSVSTSGSNQLPYLKAVSGVLSCPKAGEGQTMILHDIDPNTGNIVCYLYDETSTDPIQIFKQTGASQQLFLEEASSLKAFLDNGDYRNLTVSNRFGLYEFNSVSQGYTEKYIQQLNLGELSNINDNIKGFLDNLSHSETSDTSAFSSASIGLNSYSNSEKVLSNILSGLITLNPDYFENDKLVNPNGTIALKDYAVFGDSNSSNQSVEDDNILKKISRFIIGNNNKVENVGVNVLTIVNFIDKKFWGFYAYLIYNLKEAYMMILGSMMLFGAGFVLSKFGYSRLKQKINKDNESADKGKLASKSMDIFLIIGMFLIPISTNNATIPDTFIYSKTNQTFNTSTVQDEQLFTHSTLSASMIRYFAELGSTWANAINDYALYSYLRYLESKQKAITASGLSQNEEEIKGIYLNTFLLKKEYDYYINVCRPAFSSVLATTTRFNSISNESKEQFLNNTINLKGTPIYDFLGYTKINPLACLKIEENIAIKTKKILADYSKVQLELNVSKAIINNYNSNTASEFNKYVNFMQFVSNNYGWISSAVVPPSYSLLFQGGTSVFAYDIAQKTIANSDGNNLSQTWAGNDESKREIEDDGFIAGFVKDIFSTMQGQFVWFVMPGFEAIFKNVYQYMSNIAYLDPTYYQSSDSKLVTFIEKVIDFIGTFAWVFGKIGAAIAKSLFFLAKTLITPALYLILLFVAIYISIQIYVTLVTTVTMVIIGGAITIKICLYFMELLMYYFLSDAILFISIVTQKNDYFTKFLSKGITITLLTPLLIVLSVYVYILFHTLATELYSTLINAIYEISNVQQQTIINNSGAEAIKATFASIVIMSIQSFGEVVILLFSLIIGTVVIFKFKDWVFKMIGIEDNDFASSMMSEINNKLTGGMNPVK